MYFRLKCACGKDVTVPEEARGRGARLSVRPAGRGP